MPEHLQIRQATLADLDRLVPLFDAYRRFYRQPSDSARARAFLRERFERNESAIYLAFAAGAAIGFTQLYPSFSSGALAPIFILNDLFVAPEARRRGAASALLDAAAAHARRAGAIRLTLSTELSNPPARSLYERTGWSRDTVFCVYHLTL
jgi:ribosomal protein S18 acetylase RimI-like enzyme